MGVVGFKVGVEVGFAIFGIDKTVQPRAVGGIGVLVVDNEGIAAGCKLAGGDGDKPLFIVKVDWLAISTDGMYNPFVEIDGQIALIVWD